MSKKIIFCSELIPQEVEIKSSSASLASGKYLRNMASAFKEYGYNIISVCHVALPDAANAFIGYENNNSDKFILKDKFIIPSVLRYKKCLLKTVQPEDIVIFYNINYAQWGLAKKIKKLGAKCLLILADHTPAKDRLGFVRRFMGRRDEKEFLQFDYAVLLSQYAVKYVSSTCKVEIIEGGLDTKKFSDFKICDNKKTKTFMYAGTLESVTGVDRLLSALEQLDENCKLIITGKGSLSFLVKQYADRDSRIIFMGCVSENEYKELLINADILINPRNMDLSENQNNFPSKVLEFLATGRITISSKFPGWEKFSDNFIFYDNSVTELSNVMKEVLHDYDKYVDVYFKNRKYAENFDWSKQTKRIINLLDYE